MTEDRFLQFIRFAELVRDHTLTPRWSADGNGFWYVEGTPDRTRAVKIDATTGERTELLDVARVRELLKREIGHEPPYEGLPFADFQLLENDGVARFAVGQRAFRLRLDGYELTEERPQPQPAVTRPEAGEVRSPDGRWTATVRDRNVCLRSTVDGRMQQLTSDGEGDVAWSAAMGLRWSPDSLRVAAVREDHAGVAKVPVVHWLKPTEEVEWVPLTKAGGVLADVKLHLVDRTSGTSIAVDTGPVEDQRVMILDFARELWAVRWDRCMRTFALYAADAVTGASRLVLEETSTFVNWARIMGNYTGRPALFWLLPESDNFLWLSERDGWMHLYLYRADGSLIRQVTTGAMHVLDVVEVDETSGTAWFYAHTDGERPYDVHLYSVGLEGGDVRRLTESDGRHAASIAPSKRFFVNTHSTVSRKPRTEVRTISGEHVCDVRDADTSQLDELGWTPPEEFSVELHGERVYGVLWRPPGFDASKRYPVVESIYSGMQRTNKPHTFVDGAGVLAGALAQCGFVTFVVDTRGTPGRSRAFHEVSHGKFGQIQVPDHVEVLRALAAERPWMDLDRVGITGGSWGGYTTLRAMLTQPGVYKAGVALAPVADFEDHLAIPIEPFMGMPHENREGYLAASCLPLAQNLQGRLMIVHGTSDVNATFSASMKMVEALTRANKPYDLVVLPEIPHSLSGQSAVYAYGRLRDYFVEHLRP